MKRSVALVVTIPVTLMVLACEFSRTPSTIEAHYRYDDLVRFHSVQMELCNSGDRDACTAEHMIVQTLREGGICYGMKDWGEDNTFHVCNEVDAALEEQRKVQDEIIRMHIRANEIISPKG